MKRKALGKGLSSLIPSPPPKKPPKPETATGKQPRRSASEKYFELDIDLINPNRFQPRAEFDSVKLEALAKSLKSNGVIQPIAVRRTDGGRFELLAGERRWRAAQLAGLLKIPAVIRDVPDEQLLELALIENIQRENLNPIEEATAYRRLVGELGLSQQEVSVKVGKRRSTIANMLRLLGLPPAVQDRVKTGSISMGHARALVSLNSPGKQVELSEQIERTGISVRQVERMVAKLNAGTGAKPAGNRARRRDPNVTAAEDDLQRLLGARVRIVQGRKGGRLEIHFFDDDELRRIYELIHEAVR